MSRMIGVDVGGTFTDVFVLDEGTGVHLKRRVGGCVHGDAVLDGERVRIHGDVVLDGEGVGVHGDVVLDGEGGAGWGVGRRLTILKRREDPPI